MSRTANVTIEYVESHPIGSGVFMLLGEMLKVYPACREHKLVNVEVEETYTNERDEEVGPINATQITWDDSRGKPYSKVAVLIFEMDASSLYREPTFVIRYASSAFSEDRPRVSDVCYNVRNLANALADVCNFFLNQHAIVPIPRKYPL